MVWYCRLATIPPHWKKWMVGRCNSLQKKSSPFRCYVSSLEVFGSISLLHISSSWPKGLFQSEGNGLNPHETGKKICSYVMRVYVDQCIHLYIIHTICIYIYIHVIYMRIYTQYVHLHECHIHTSIYIYMDIYECVWYTPNWEKI